MDALPQVALEGGQNTLAMLPVAAVTLEAVGLVHDGGRQIRSVVVGKLAAFRDAAAAQHAVRRLGDDVEVLGALQVVVASRMRAHPRIDLAHLVGHPVEVDHQIAHHGQVVQRFDEQRVAAESVKQLVELRLAGQVRVAVDLHRAAAANGVAARAREAQARVLFLADLRQAPQQRAFRIGNGVFLVERALPVEAAHVERDHPVCHQYFLSSGANFVTATGRYPSSKTPSSRSVTNVCAKNFSSSRTG